MHNWRADAVRDLFGTIYHQGTIFDATAPAVSYLYSIMKSLDQNEAHEKANLIAYIATGNGFYSRSAPMMPDLEVPWQQQLAKRGTTLEAERDRVSLHRPVREAVSEHLLSLLPFLSSCNPEHRQQIAIALGRFPEHAESVPVLLAQLAVEPRHRVRYHINHSINRITMR